MRVMMPRMISPGSLAAFSASVAATLPSARAGGVPGLLPVREQILPSQAKPALGARPTGMVPQPGQRLPRGSLLDLQV